MDYKALLAKYMAHVRDIEGIDFTDRGSLIESDVNFTEDEISALTAVSEDGAP